MTIGAIAGVVATAPAGAWVDASNRKRTLLVIPGLCAVLAPSVILTSQSFWPVAISQVATAMAGVAIGTAVNGPRWESSDRADFYGRTDSIRVTTTRVMQLERQASEHSAAVRIRTSATSSKKKPDLVAPNSHP
jgi:hypothetical protein